jgi:decaprenylphospho-beta-D-ribofuranose 2-oxidase
MLSSLSSSRSRAVISLAGVALSIVGFFLPMFTESNPSVPGSAHPVYEWQVVMRLASSSVLAGSFAALSLLGVLIVLATSVAILFAVYGPRLVLLKDLAAKWGLAIQLSFAFTVLQILSIGSARIEIAWGFVVLLIGFMVIFGSALRLQTTFTPLTCILLAIGSLILGLEWIFFDFFVGMVVIDLYTWLPLIVLLGVVALLMTKQWATTALTIPLVIVSLYGLYYLLLGIGSIALIPASIIVPTVIILLILLNGSVFWMTHRLLKAGRQREKKDVHLKRRSFLKILTKTTFSLAIGSLFIKTYIWDDPSKQWLLTDLFQNENETQKLTLAPPLGTLLNDASHLNRTSVKEIRSPKTVAEVIKAVSDAKSTNKKVSLSGIRHSMGGQALGLNTLHLDMTHMDSVRYNTYDQTVTVGPGATWRQVQESLSQNGRAVRVMQDSNIFSVGGSLSVNAHGKDPQYGSLIESVNFIKIVTADGKEIFCDRATNTDLFSAVIGGYGLLGIITEVNLLTTQNSIYSFSLIPIQTHALIDTLESLRKNPENRLLEAHLSVDGEHFLTESLIYKYSEAHSFEKPKDELDGENNIWLRKVVFQASRVSNFGKLLRWEIEKYITPLIESKTVSRNTAMAVPVRFLQNPDPHSTDILQEYYIPTEQANTFLESYKKLIKKYNINLLNVTIRKVSKDINALVSYAQKDMYGFVVYYKVNQKSTDIQTMNAFTRELMDYLISIKATYYLCYGSYYSQSQLTTMYPEIRTLFVLKTQQDPDRLFTNLWYEKYRGGISDSPIF